ncbi:DUF3021 domain-containing protein [Virgibacillus sp. W0430]|uniref:DUF3021 domain-containing protein n=1 Tax=Virgibacillus sp. W0430 TaxID=3391580 RepID=UPI003F475A07
MFTAVEVLKRSMLGIAYGAIFTFIFLTVAMLNNLQTSVRVVWESMLASFILGIFFGLASFIFEHEDWSPLKKTVIHFSLSITCYFTIALFIGWIPLHVLAIVSTIFIFIVIYTIFWLGYTVYFKKLEARLNDELKKGK